MRITELLKEKERSLEDINKDIKQVQSEIKHVDKMSTQTGGDKNKSKDLHGKLEKLQKEKEKFEGKKMDFESVEFPKENVQKVMDEIKKVWGYGDSSNYGSPFRAYGSGKKGMSKITMKNVDPTAKSPNKNKSKDMTVKDLTKEINKIVKKHK